RPETPADPGGRRVAGISRSGRHDQSGPRRRPRPIRRQPAGRHGIRPARELQAASCRTDDPRRRQPAMTMLRDLPIRRKLLVVGLVTASAALIVMSLASLVF